MSSLMRKRRFTIAVTLALVVSFLLPWQFVFGNDRSDTEKSSVKSAIKSSQIAALNGDDDNSDIKILRVEVLYGGSEQAKYRESTAHNMSQYTVYKGDDPVLATNNEDPAKYYTTSRRASLSDPRVFTISFDVDASVGSGFENGLGTGAGYFDTSKIDWTYGGKALSAWRAVSGSVEPSGKVIRAENVTADDSVLDVITITADIRFGVFYSKVANSNRNKPYDDYYVATSNPSKSIYNSIGDFQLKAFYNSDSVTELANRNIHMNLYDSFNTWDEIDAFARKNQVVDRLVNGNPRYMKMDSVGKSVEGREMWTAVISDSQTSIDQYLNETSPAMQNNPAALDVKVGSAGDDVKTVLYFSTIHGNETVGPDVTMEVIQRLLFEENLKFSRRIDSPGNYTRVTPTSPGGYAQRGFREINQSDKYSSSKIEEVSLNIDDLLSKYIVVMTFTSNPDGRANMRRTSAYAFDMNRDASYQSQVESQAVGRAFGRWDPMTMVEFHGWYDTFMIDAPTPPHEPNFEYDLIRNHIVDMADSFGMGFIGGNTPFYRYAVPTRDVVYQWDDGTTIFTPTLAELYGALASTIEFPYASQDSIDCGVAGVASFFDWCLQNRDVLVKDKLEGKTRAVNNVDAKDKVDPYLTSIDPLIKELDLSFVDSEIKVGRPREAGKSFFPEYYVIPIDQTNQRNSSAAYEMLDTLKRLNVQIKQTNQSVTVAGVTYPSGTYVIDMHQGNRNVANGLLYKGYDASIYPRLYSNMVANHPDMRGFDAIRLDVSGVFDGKTTTLQTVSKKSVSVPTSGKYTIVKNNGEDAIRLVNRLLNDGKDAWMIKATNNSAEIGDFVVNRADIAAAVAPASNIILGDLALYVDCVKFGDTLPLNAQKLVRPDNLAIFANGYPENVAFLLDKLEFSADWVELEDDDDDGVVPDDTTVVISYYGYNPKGNYPVINDYIGCDVRERGIPFICLGGRNSVSETPYVGNLGSNVVLLDNEDKITVGSYGYNSATGEALVKASYSAGSVITSHFDRQNTTYTNSGMWFESIPDFMQPLCTVSDDKNFYIEGWWPPGNKSFQSLIRGKIMAASGIYTVPDTGVKVPITSFADYIVDKGQNEVTYRMVANALFAYSADILDDGVSRGDDLLTDTGNNANPTSISISGATDKYAFKASGNNVLQLKALLAPANATGATVNWSVTGPASIDSTGRVTFNDPGADKAFESVVVTAAAGSVTASVTIKLVKNVTAAATPLKTISIVKGKKLKLPVAIYDGKQEINTLITWKSSKPKIATVGANNTIKIASTVKKKTKVTLTGTFGNGKKIVITVFAVPKAVTLKSLKVKGWPAKNTLKNGASLTLRVSVNPKAATGAVIKFKSSNPGIVKVDKAGKLTALKKGKVTITVKIGKKTVQKSITVK